MARRVTRRRERLRSTLSGVGTMLLVGSGVMATSAAVGAIYGDGWSTVWFLVAAAFTAATGYLAARSPAPSKDFDDVDAMSTAALGWAALAVWGGLPFVLAAHLTPDSVIAGYIPPGAGYDISSLTHFRDPLHAVFEAMSGWTTTGLTMSVNEPTMPHAFLMYRSMMQWTGGAGIIVLALSVFQQHGGARGLYLYRAEARQRQIRPSIIETARRVWRIYVAITAALAGYLFIAMLVLLPDYPVTAAAFDAINHAMTGQATGGFSTLDESIAGYGSYAAEMVHLLPMISGAIALPVHYLALAERQPRTYLRDVQNRTLFGGFAVGCIVLPGLLVGGAAVADPAREGIFQFISALTGTGWQTSDIGGWPAGAAFFILAPMIVGGAAGSTVGGIKLLRAIYLVRGAAWRVREVFQPSTAVNIFRVGERTLRLDDFERESGRAAVFLFLWIVMMAASALLMTVALDGGFTLADVLFESATAQNTVGLSADITAPDMPTPVEAMFIFQMWIGRLEIIPVLVLIRALMLRTRW